MSQFSASKVLSNPPESPTTPNTLFLVRVGTGFDLYCSDITGNIIHKLNNTVVDVNPAIKDYIGSRSSSNLITNGSGLLGTNYNFTNTKADFTDTNGSTCSFIHDPKENVILTEEYLPITSSDIINTSISFKASSGLYKLFVFLNCYDSDRLQININNIMAHRFSMSRSSTYYTSQDSTSTESQVRSYFSGSLAIGIDVYKTSQGSHTPGYTRYVSEYRSVPSGTNLTYEELKKFVFPDGKTLDQYYDMYKDSVSGTEFIRLGLVKPSGTFIYPNSRLSNYSPPATWTTESFSYNCSRLRVGTRYVKLGVLVNNRPTDGVLRISNVNLNSIPFSMSGTYLVKLDDLLPSTIASYLRGYAIAIKNGPIIQWYILLTSTLASNGITIPINSFNSLAKYITINDPIIKLNNNISDPNTRVLSTVNYSGRLIYQFTTPYDDTFDSLTKTPVYLNSTELSYRII